MFKQTKKALLLSVFMLVVCLMFDQVIGALLFGIAILIQNVLNAILIKYFSHNKRRV
jgi:hypothetical protein